MEKHLFTTMLGKQLRKRRNEQDYNQAELAYQAGIDEKFLGAIENGKKNPSSYKLYMLCDVLNISVDEMHAYIKSRGTTDN